MHGDMDLNQKFFIVNVLEDSCRGTLVYSYPADVEEYSNTFDDMISTRPEFERSEHQLILFEHNMSELRNYSSSMTSVLPYFKALLDMPPADLYACMRQCPRFKMVFICNFSHDNN